MAASPALRRPVLPPPPAWRLWLVGHVASAHLEGSFDVAVGGAALVAHHRDGALAVAAAGVSAEAYSERGNGRVAAELLLGWEGPLGARLGLSLAPHLEFDPIERPLPGAAATGWLFVGVAPYVRVSTTRETGAAVELGLAIALPSLRW